MVALKDYGWNDFHQQNYSQSGNYKELVGRVVSVLGFKYHLITEAGEVEAELAGRMLYGVEPEDLPKVGDWVCYLGYEESGYIIERLPRQNALSRKKAGKTTDRQVIGTNIDYACVVQSLDRDFNLMRLERYMTQIAACGITPIVVLNKCDLVDEALPYIQRVYELNRNCEVLTCSTVTGIGLDELRDALTLGKTYVMIGSSGVGKSSLLNVLMNSDIQATSEISDFNNRGRHTTTARELFRLPNGSLLIDTPGMREFGVTNEDGSEDDLFPVIEEFAQECRYADCTHTVEEGCRVLSALTTGELNPMLYESYSKLLREQKRFGIRAEDKKRMNRQFGKMVKEAKDYRKKYKY
jgi:ribosome biogenesis GTPase / thiamine phosphate phosphatase